MSYRSYVMLSREALLIVDHINDFAKFVFHKSACLLVLVIVVTYSTSVPATAAPQEPVDFMGLPRPINAKWFRLLEAGEKALAAHKEDLAKSYFMASLADLEVSAPVQHRMDLFFMTRLSGIEQRLSYWHDERLPGTKDDTNKELSMREEQVSILRRIATLNARILPASDRLVSASQERFQVAKKNLDTLNDKLKKETAPKQGAGTEL